MTTMHDIEQLAAHHAADRGELSERVADLKEAIDKLKREALPGIREAVHKAADSRDRLTAAIDNNRALFERPRTRVFAGIRCGLVKGRGKIEWDDEEKVIDRIRAKLPRDQVELLVRVNVAVQKSAVYDLSAEDLKRLGIRITGNGDQVVVKPTDGDVDKLVTALLGDVENETEPAGQ